MMSMNSNNASSSGVGSSKGPPTCAWVSLTLEEQLANFRTNFERILRECYSIPVFPGAESLESIAKVVKALRIDPWVDIKGLLHRGLDKYGALDGATPLHWAVMMDDRTMVQYILTSKKVDINVWKVSGVQLALNYAIVGGNCDIVGDLLEHKADVCISNFFQKSALYYMVHHKDSMFGILQKVLANNVNMCDIGKNTTLHFATMEGAIDVVTCLLQQNADVNASSYLGRSPLHNAIANGEMNIISILMEHNANVQALDIWGWSPLLYSIKYQNVDAFNALIAIGVDVHVKDKNNNNALHFAIQVHDEDHNMMDIVKVLREHDVNANVKNRRGYSPFFAAVFQGHTTIVKELLQIKRR